MQLESVVHALNQRRFLAKAFSTAEEAKTEMLRIIGNGSVGIGGSKTINDTGIYQDLLNHGNQVFCHTFVPKEEKQAARRAALNADVYLCSANAVTENGILLNIDGTGNRVAGTIFGPSTVILLVGRNKLVSTVEEGIERTKRENCPNNARRLGVNTPCAATGKCMDCTGTGRMCNVTILHEYPTRNVTHFYVFLVDQDLGW